MSGILFFIFASCHPLIRFSVMNVLIDAPGLHRGRRACSKTRFCFTKPLARLAKDSLRSSLASLGFSKALDTRALRSLLIFHRPCYTESLTKTTHNEEPEIRNRILWEGVRFFRCRRKPECPEKTYQGGYGIGKPNSHTTTGQLHW